jgi:hypothetical protein
MFEVGDKVVAVTHDSLNGMTGVVVDVYDTGVDVFLDEDEVKIPLTFLKVELKKVEA